MNNYSLKVAIFLTILLHFLHTQTLFAQNPDILNGYYRSSAGDSLTGQINISNLKNNILKFRASKDANWTVIRPSDVKLVVGEKGLFIRTQSVRNSESEEEVFLQKILGGTYSLYKGISSKRGRLYFLEINEQEKVIQINQFGFAAQLKSLLGLCGQDISSNNLQYTTVSLSRFIRNVNQCTNPGEIPFVYKGTSKLKFGFGFNAGINQINPVVKEGSYYLSGDFHKPFKMTAGVFTKIAFSPLISIQVGINYVDKRLTTDSIFRRLEYKIDKPGVPPYKTYNNYRFILDLNCKYLEFPISMTYSFLPYTRWSPTATFGYVAQVPIVTKMESEWGYPVGTNLPPGETGYIYPTWMTSQKSFTKGFFGGFGIRHVFRSKRELEIKAEYYNQLERLEVGTNKLDPTSVIQDLYTSRYQVSVYYSIFFKNKK